MTDVRRYQAFIVPHTHWDREWYHPFRVFQLRLADVIDAVLELLEDSTYRRFTLDGQAVVLEDYLQLRPEREADLRRHVQAGRLRIGPWYVLADEFLVSPEALVRNLLLGREVCRRFGRELPVAYTPDSFGHISQLPLIAKGFGLESIVFERGVGDEGERLGSEFTWVGADGHTKVFAVHLVGTYSGAAALGHVSWELTDPYDAERARAHLAAALYGERTKALADLPAWFRASLERVDGGLVRHTNGSALVLLNGSDHLFPQPNLPEVVASANEWFPDVEFLQADVEEYVRAAQASAGALAEYQGEFRGSRYQHILAGVLSARLYLKQANEEAETLLERYAEPLATVAWAATGEYPAAFLREAWSLLLQNHPHDSICGCSIDVVHREMLTRFENVRQIGADVCRRSHLLLAESRPANVQDVHEEGVLGLAAFNPLPRARRVVAERQLDLPLGRSASLAVLDAAGTPLPLQLETDQVYAPGSSDTLQERTLLRVLADLPPLGFGNLQFVEGPAAPTPELAGGRISGADVELWNDLVHLTLLREGGVRLRDLRSGRVEELSLGFEDAADAGDEYDFSPLPHVEPLRFGTPAAASTLNLAGPLVTSASLRYELGVPESLAPDRRSRVGHVTLPVTLEFTLRAASPLVELRVTLDNRASDHRLRLVVGTGVRTSTVWADGHFDVLERPLRPPAGEGWFQSPPPTNHQRRFVAVAGAAGGVAILNRGLPEYEAWPGKRGTDVAVTLVRSVGWLSRNDLLSRPQGAGPALEAPEAQCLGVHDCRLALYAFEGAWWASELLHEAEAFGAPPLVFSGRTRPMPKLFEVSGLLQVTAVKRADDREGLIVRVANPAPVTAAGELRLGGTHTIFRTRLDETRLEQLPTGASQKLELGPRSVETFELVPRGGEG